MTVGYLPPAIKLVRVGEDCIGGGDYRFGGIVRVEHLDRDHGPIIAYNVEYAFGGARDAGANATNLIWRDVP